MADSKIDRVEFSLPNWIAGYCDQYVAGSNASERMRFVITAAKENVERKTGGPFAAAIFDERNGELISLGVNLVTTQGMSMLHAEMVAIAVAQKRLGTYDLGADSAACYSLFSTTEPCAMCLGAIPWSGVRKLVTGAREEDARRIGFDEGAKPVDWVGSLTSRGIAVVEAVERRAAAEVLDHYASLNGHIYSSREGG